MLGPSQPFASSPFQTTQATFAAASFRRSAAGEALSLPGGQGLVE